MNKMQTQAFVDDPNIKEIVLGGLGAISMVLFGRWLNNKDSVKVRLRKLEMGHEIIKSEHEFIKNTLINVQDQQKKQNDKLIDLDRDVQRSIDTVEHTLRNVKFTQKLIEDNFLHNRKLTK